jgi:excisionase family DNA binding protein
MSEPDSDHEILNLQEAADFLGVSSKTFQKVLREGDVPGRKVGREWKFSRAALANWVGGGRSRDFLDASDDLHPSPARRASPLRRGRRRRPDGEFSAEED